MFYCYNDVFLVNYSCRQGGGRGVSGSYVFLLMFRQLANSSSPGNLCSRLAGCWSHQQVVCTIPFLLHACVQRDRRSLHAVLLSPGRNKSAAHSVAATTLDSTETRDTAPSHEDQRNLLKKMDPCDCSKSKFIFFW